MPRKSPNEFDLLRKKLGKNIKKARESAKFTQMQMADEPYPIQLRDYQHIEAGEQNVTFDRLARLAKKLDCSMSTFFKGI